jgi:hypothetical protein
VHYRARSLATSPDFQIVRFRVPVKPVQSFYKVFVVRKRLINPPAHDLFFDLALADLVAHQDNGKFSESEHIRHSAFNQVSVTLILPPTLDCLNDMSGSLPGKPSTILLRECALVEEQGQPRPDVRHRLDFPGIFTAERPADFHAETEFSIKPSLHQLSVEPDQPGIMVVKQERNWRRLSRPPLRDVVFGPIKPGLEFL